MEAIFSSETSVDIQQSIRHHVPEDRTLDTSSIKIRKIVKTDIAYVGRSAKFGQDVPSVRMLVGLLSSAKMSRVLQFALYELSKLFLLLSINVRSTDQ
jgi:hypothetical protein